MIFRDSDGFIVDSNLDGGDSANRAGLSALFGNKENLTAYEITAGILVRHPKQSPWNNPKNFSRDQLLPFVGGAWRLGLTELNRRVFKAYAKRFFFSQNIERDLPGTKKFPWPHFFIDDRHQKVFKLFDFADPLGPSDIWHLILCSRFKTLYVFAVIGYPALAFSILMHAILNHSDDEGQVISKAVVGGRFFIWLYTTVNPKWKQTLARYWVERRKMAEMHQLIVQNLGPKARLW